MVEDDDLLKARICELLESWQPWQRRLWDLGTVLALREAVEAADWVERQVLSSAATSWYAHESLLPRIGADRVIGDAQIRRQLQEVCRRPLRAGTRGQRTLSLLADLIADGYLDRWRALVADGGPFNVERAARCVAAHLLDQGFHQDYLRSKVKAELAADATAVDLLDLFIDLEHEGEKEFSGFVILQGKIPALDSAERSASQVVVAGADVSYEQPERARSMLSIGPSGFLESRSAIAGDVGDLDALTTLATATAALAPRQG